jgi:hypothetical protein
MCDMSGKIIITDIERTDIDTFIWLLEKAVNRDKDIPYEG